MSKIKPMNLKEKNINRIFKYCLANNRTQNPLRCVLFQKERGFTQESTPIFFDKDFIQETKPGLEYMLGQLKAVHLKEPFLTVTGAKKTYFDTDWTNNKNLIIAFLHLAIAADLLSLVDAKTGKMTFLKEIFPTLHSKDPNFANWMRENSSLLEPLYSSEEQ